MVTTELMTYRSSRRIPPALAWSLVHVSTESVLIGERMPPLLDADETWPRPRKPIGLYPLTKGLFRAFVTALLRTQGIVPGGRSMPRWLAGMVAGGGELIWRILRLSGQPPLTRSAVHLFGQVCTVSDTKARHELGYSPPIGRAVELARLADVGAGHNGEASESN